ncbi:ABC transporter ATP-binding protein [Infirmifilum lucidum]|uniref:ABC transporter ATP-binding protein n=1 Tax=Infirmifilum lucidum TaxID=2776706 RepID=A0A7L9FEF0_9CREN|nr:ABC transporter ATP-binding protein [Infirmifilum lucidum]QOJ78067.1 ABC transporter ATP-binding protein [Infirmifilum lucidum]
MGLLDVEDLSVGYGKMEIVNGVSFSAYKNEIFVIVGPNGSGKSTLLKGLFGLAKVFRGRVLFNGNEVTSLPPHKKSLLGLAYLPQLGNTFENLSVYENLVLAAHDLPRDKFEERLSDILGIFPALRNLLRRKVKTLSGGERQMLALAMNLLRNPLVLMMDEPTAALSPKLAAQVFNQIQALRNEHGLTIILVEQNALKALEIGDRALLLVSGQPKFYGASKELLENRELAKLYLGI